MFEKQEANELAVLIISQHPELQAKLDELLDKAADCDPDLYGLDPEFLGFLQQYYCLSQCIPKNRVIYDMGCNAAIQSVFFLEHAGYVGLDPVPIEKRLHTPNSEHLQMCIQDFIHVQENGHSRHELKHPNFAICNYVPPWWHGSSIPVRQFDGFDDVFTFYPKGT